MPQAWGQPGPARSWPSSADPRTGTRALPHTRPGPAPLTGGHWTCTATASRQPRAERTLRSQQRPEPIPGAPSASAAKRMSVVNTLHLAGPEASTPRLGSAPWGLTLSRQLQAALLGSGLCLRYKMASSFLSTLRKYLPCLSSALFVSLMPFYP